MQKKQAKLHWKVVCLYILPKGANNVLFFNIFLCCLSHSGQRKAQFRYLFVGFFSATVKGNKYALEY